MQQTKSTTNKVLCLTGGGTMGHISPNLALLPELKKHFSKIIYIGEENSMEQKKAKEFDIEFFAVPAIKFDRKNPIKNLKIPFVLMRSAKQVQKILETQKANIIFSKGGFVSVPVMLGAKKAKVNFILHESDMSMGLANRTGAQSAKLIFVSTEKTKNNLPEKYLSKTIITGIPTNDEFSRKVPIKTQGFKIPDGKKMLLVTGGSQGAKTINNLIRENLHELTKKYFVVHITGKKHFDPKIKHDSYHQIDFTNQMPSLMKRADVILSRAGATIIFESIKAETPILLIPLPKSKHSRGDQVENAKYFSSLGITHFLEEQNLSTNALTQKLEEIENNKIKIKNNMNSYQKQLKTNSQIAEIIKDQAQKH